MRTETKGLTLFASTCLALLAGCPPTYPKCDNDEQCTEHNEVCVNGQCQECATNANCKAGFVCQANKCAPKPECVDDGSCAAGKKCTSGKCVVDPNAKKVGSCSANSDCGAGEECSAGYCVTTTTTAKCDYAPIRFDFNEARLSADAQTVLSRLADCVKRDKAKLVLEGHADERGTEEYNLQLSNRRATAVKRYLVDLGVSTADLDTVGYGENKPAVNASTEDAWAANRRVEPVRK